MAVGLLGRSCPSPVCAGVRSIHLRQLPVPCVRRCKVPSILSENDIMCGVPGSLGHTPGCRGTIALLLGQTCLSELTCVCVELSYPEASSMPSILVCHRPSTPLALCCCRCRCCARSQQSRAIRLSCSAAAPKQSCRSGLPPWCAPCAPCLSVAHVLLSLRWPACLPERTLHVRPTHKKGLWQQQGKHVCVCPRIAWDCLCAS